MNSTWDRVDTYQDAFIKNFILVFLAIILNYINGTFVFILVSNQIFYIEARYILYINLLLNDMFCWSITVALHVTAYILPFYKMPVCFVVLILADTSQKNTLLNLAGMAIERYIAICVPLRHAQVCTARRTLNVLAITWGLAATPVCTDIIITLVTQPLSFLSTSLMCSPENVFNTPYHMVRITVVLVIYLSFVWITLVFTYSGVMLAVKASTADAVSGEKARNTILLHAVQVMLCMLSYISPWCVSFFVPLFPERRTTILFSTFVISNVTPRVISPLIYGIRDQKLFAQMKGIFKRRLPIAKVEPTQKSHLHVVRPQNKH